MKEIVLISHSPPPVSAGRGQFLKRGDQKKMIAWGDLKSSCHEYLLGDLLFLVNKKTFKNKIWLLQLNFKCWSWPVLAKQPVNVYFCDTLVLVFAGCSEISYKCYCETCATHWNYQLSSSVPGEQKILLGCGLLVGGSVPRLTLWNTAIANMKLNVQDHNSF